MKPGKAFLLVAAITFAVHLPSLGSEFVRWDDDRNFLEHESWRGLGTSQLSWMLTRFHLGHYQPLSWITLGADYAIGGMNPLGYHLTNVLLHALSAGVLAVLAGSLIAQAKGRPGPAWLAAFVALFWSLHPLRVEAVSWVTQRREVLCGLLTLLAILSRDRGRPWWTTALLAVGAMLAKVTAVTIPFVLVLLDAWKEEVGGPGLTARRLGRAAARHAHLFVLAAVFVAISFAAQRETGALVTTDALPLASRAALYGFGAAFAIVKTVWPSGLAPLHQGQLGTATWDLQPFVWWGAACGAAAIAAVLIVGWARRRVEPGWLALGLAFAILVAPAGGLGQSGPQIAADRYTYQPGWVLALAVAPLLAALWRRVPGWRTELVAGAVLLALAAANVRQQGFWKSSESLWRREVAVYPDNPVGNYNLGLLLSLRRPPDVAGAELHLRKAVASDSGYVDAQVALAELLRSTGRRAEALEAFASVLARRGGALPPAALRLGGMLFWDAGRRAEALESFTRLVAADPRNPVAYRQLGKMQAATGRPREAIATWERGLAIAPDDALANELAWLLATNPDPQVRDGRRALALAEAIGVRESTRWGLAATLAAARAEAGDCPGAARELESVLPQAPEARKAALEAILAELRAGRPVRVEPVYP